MEVKILLTLPNCPSCNSEYTYEDRGLFICSLCAHEWNPEIVEEIVPEQIEDAHGTPLVDGDSVIVIKDLKVRGSSSSVKKGIKVKNIKLIHDPSDGHDIDCRIDGFGQMKLKSEFVKKA
ncbi:MAG: alkylphosphonate utilization protein [Tissierellia bacterium]|nr:alkylphosphonate utilization protein [Tissierellia bacterium]